LAEKGEKMSSIKASKSEKGVKNRNQKGVLKGGKKLEIA